MSEDLNDFNDVGKIGCIVGYVVFFLGYIYTVCRVFSDISTAGKELDQDISNDMAKIAALNLTKNLPEMQAELAKRLSGAKIGEGGDDQLLDEAGKLTEAEFSQYMNWAWIQFTWIDTTYLQNKIISAAISQNHREF